MSFVHARPTCVLIVLGLILGAPAGAQPTSWTAGGIGGGGSLFGPSFSPYQESEAYLGCDMGEMFHTTDSGVSWQVLPFTQIQGGDLTQVQFTDNPQVLYSLHNNNNGYTPLKSTDGGAHWTPLSGDPTGADAWGLAADPANSQRLIVIDYSSLWISTDGGNSFGAARYRTGSPGGCYLAGVWFDGATIAIGTNEGLLSSTDGGASFRLAALPGVPAGQALVSMAAAKAGGVTRFVATVADTSNIYVGIPGSDYWGLCRGIYACDGVGGNWVSRSSGIDLNNDFPFFAAMARSDINTAYVAGGSSGGNPEIFKTTNAGVSWSQVFLTANNRNIATGYCGDQGDLNWSWAECPLGFTVAPLDPNRIMITDFGFAHLSTDGGASWRQAYATPGTQNPPGLPTPKGKAYQTDGLNNTSCWWLTWVDANRIFASFTDIKGIRSTDGGSTWSFRYTGHTQNTMYQALLHPDGALYAATSTVHDLYQSTYLQDSRIDAGSGQALFCLDGGATWQTLHDFTHPVIFLALDGRHPHRLYASVVHSTQGGIFVTNDLQDGGTSSWTRLAAPPRTQGHPFNVYVLRDSSVVCTYSGRRDGSGAFTASSGVFLSTNGGASWIDRSDPGMRYWTKDLVVSPADTTQSTWYAGVFSGWGGPPNDLGGLYRTTNRGVSWVRLVQMDGVESCAFNPANLNECYVATEDQGLWVSENIGSAAPSFSLVDSYAFAHPTRCFFNPDAPGQLWVTSFGNGISLADLGGSSGSSENPPRARVSILAWPEPARGQITFSLHRPGNEPVTARIFDASGRKVLEQTFAGPAGDLSGTVELRGLAAGAYYLRAVCGTQEADRRITIVR